MLADNKGPVICQLAVADDIQSYATLQKVKTTKGGKMVSRKERFGVFRTDKSTQQNDR